jgi:hypothetical protein
MDGLLMKIIKCKNTTERKGIEHECGRFIAKFINEQQMHIKCPSCPAYTIIRVVEGDLMVVHVDKEGEEQICQKK